MSDLVKLAEALADAIVHGKRATWDQLSCEHADLDITLGAVGVFAIEPLILFGEAHRALRQRVAELEARPVHKAAGVWSPDLDYVQGDLVSHGGSAWVSNWKSRGLTPGKNSAWTLFVQRGKDGKDLR